MSNYTNYFKKHFNIEVSERDITLYKQWFLTQWKFICSKVSIRSNSRILEIGSGIGILYSFLEPVIQGKHYTGLELDKSTADFTNIFFKSNNFKNESIEEFTSLEKYKYIFAFEVLEHVSDPSNVIQKIHSLLSQGGIFIGSSPFPYRKNVYADETHRYVLHPSNWEKLFKENGFVKVKTYPMSFIPFLWRIHPVFNIRIPWYIPFPYFITTTLIIAHK